MQGEFKGEINKIFRTGTILGVIFPLTLLISSEFDSGDLNQNVSHHEMERRGKGYSGGGGGGGVGGKAEGEGGGGFLQAVP